MKMNTHTHRGQGELQKTGGRWWRSNMARDGTETLAALGLQGCGANHYATKPVGVGFSSERLTGNDLV